MNEPIMRRGLSPEGRIIRQKHQGSLLNDEFGVTSLPVQKKIEKDFLKENVMRLKEIQAKCRTQESRPISGSQPVKAIRPSNIELSYRDITYDDIATDEKGTKSNGRDGSAHSDYFSLPDEASNERDQNLRQICSQNRMIRSSPCHERYCAKAPSIVSLDQLNGSVKASVKNNSNYMNVLTARNNEVLDCKKVDLANIKTSSPKFKECFPQSPSLRRNKLSNIIEKIKSKPPACETNTEYIWRDIRKEHRTLFLADECLSIGTPRTPHLVSLKNAVPAASKDSGCNKRSLLARSRSLDRRSIRPKSVMSQNFDSAYTLDPRPKSTLPTKMINLKQEYKELPPQLSNKYEFPHTFYQTESLPNLLDIHEKMNGNLKSNPDFIFKNQVPCSTSAALLCATNHDGPNFKNNVSSNGSWFTNQNTSTSTAVSDSQSTVNDEQNARDSVAISPCDENPIPATLTAEHNSFNTVTEKELSRIAGYGPSTSPVVGDLTFTISDILHPNREEPARDEDQHLSLSADVGDSSFFKKDMLLKRKNINAENEHSEEVGNELIALSKSSSDPNLDTVEKGRINAPILTKKHHQTKYQQSNQQKAGNNSLLRSKSTNNLHLAGEPPPTYKRGHLPNYLKNRKAETQRRLEAAAAIDPLCPPGHSPVPDPERRNTLHLLKKAEADVIRQLSSLPVAQDTLRVRKLRNDLETKLSQIEDGISIFSQPKVYVLNEDE